MGRDPRLNSERPQPIPPEVSEPHFVRHEPDRKPHRLRRALTVIGAIVGTTATVVVATVGGVVLHIGLPPARRLIAGTVNGILGGSFKGQVAITRLDSFGLGGLDGGVATITTPDGKRVLLLEGIHARVSLPRLAWSAIAGKGDIEVRVNELGVDHVEALIEQEEDGSLTLVHAFDPKEPDVPKPTTEKGRGVAIDMPKIAIGHVWAHGGIAAVPVIDAEIGAADAAFGMNAERTELTMRRFALNTRSLPEHADLVGTIEAHLVLPAKAGMAASLAFVGTVGGIGAKANAAIDDKKVDAVIDVPRAEAAQVRAMVASAPIFQPASAHVEAHGTLPSLAPTAHVTLGEGTVDVDGTIVIPDEKQTDMHADVNVHAKDVDVRGFSETGPASKIATDLHAVATMTKAGAIRGTYDLHVPPGAIAGQAIPDVKVNGSFTEAALSGGAHVSEPGAPIDATFTVHRDMSIDFDTRARIPSLDRLQRVKVGSGSVSLHGAGRVSLASQQVTAHVEAQVDGITASGVGVAHATVAAIVSGSLQDPVIDANVAGSHLKAGGYDFGAFAVSTQGTTRSPTVAARLQGEGMPTIEAKATLETQGGFGAKAVSLGLSRDGVVMNAKVASVKTGGGAIAVEGVEVLGLGTPFAGSFHMRGKTLSASAHAEAIDLVRVARLLDLRDVDRGTLGLDVDLESKRGEAKGHATIDVKKAHMASIPNDASAHFQATFDGHKVEGTLDADVDQVGSAKVAIEDVDLGGSFEDPKAWKAAKGRIRLDSNFDLDRVSKALPVAIPIDDVRGWLNIHAIVHRDQRTGMPDGEIALATRGLSLTTQPKEVANPDGTFHFEGSPFHTDGVDLKAGATFAGASGDSSLNATITDKIGTLAALTVKTKAPIDALRKGEDMKALLLATPVNVHFETPERSLQALPSALGPVPIKGTVSLLLDATGTARAPRVVFEARTRDLVHLDEPTPVPVSADAVLTYDGADARAQIVGTRPEGKVVELSGDVHVSSAAILDGDGKTPVAWTASAKGGLFKFPLEAIGDLVGQRIKGTITGAIDLEDLHKNGRLEGNLDLRDLRVQGASFPHGSVSILVTEGQLKAAARLEQADGFADVRASGAMHWGDAVAPALDDTKPVDLTLSTKAFRIIAAQPFVRTTFNQLDGRLDGDAHIRMNPGGKDGTMSGAIVLRDGVMEAAAVGEEFHNVGARVIMKRWGTVRLDDFQADGVTGHVSASGTAQLAGFHFKQAQALVKIAQSQKIPIAVQGVSYGSAWGTIETTAKMAPDGKAMNIDVNVPGLTVILPQSTGNAVQALDDDPNIKIGARARDGKLVIVPLGPPAKVEAPKDAMPIRIATHLRNIQVKRDTMLKITVTGDPVIQSGNTTTVDGQLNLPEGFLEVQGKRFKIEKGTVTFSAHGEPSNPIVIASAYYDAPDGTRVYADFVGPVKTGKLSLRSEPQLSQNEILSLLLFGSADGSVGSSGSGDESDVAKAAGLAGGVVTQGLNKAISGVSSVEVTTKVDTTEANNPRPQVEVQISPKVTAQVSYGLGVPPPGQNPDTTMLTVDWRFIRNWTAEATIGDKGTSILDLTWRYRY